MLPCMSKYRFFRIRIPILTSKIISGLLDADPEGQPGTDREVTFRYAFIYVKIYVC